MASDQIKDFSGMSSFELILPACGLQKSSSYGGISLGGSGGGSWGQSSDEGSYGSVSAMQINSNKFNYEVVPPAIWAYTSVETHLYGKIETTNNEFHQDVTGWAKTLEDYFSTFAKKDEYADEESATALEDTQTIMYPLYLDNGKLNWPLIDELLDLDPYENTHTFAYLIPVAEALKQAFNQGYKEGKPRKL